MSRAPLACRATSSTDEFLARTRPFLVSRAVECSSLLTDSARAAGRGEPGPLRPGRRHEQVWAWVEGGASDDGNGQIVAVCGVGPRGGWLSPGPVEAGPLLARTLRAAEVPLDVANGPPDILGTFTSAWCEGSPLRTEEGMPLGVYVAGEVRYPDGVAGRMRPAVLDDSALLGAWGTAFAREVDVARITADVVSGRIAAGQVAVWEVDGDVVSMAAAAPHAGDVSRLYLVYTPPELRGRGYASACVANLTAREQATTAGYRCMLYTDLANAATNRIYAAIGYRRIGTLSSVRFEPAG